MKTITCLIPIFLFLCKMFAQSPGGIAKPDVWLKGNFSSDENRMTTINFNPAIAMEKGAVKVNLDETIEELQRVTVFTVYHDSITDNQKNIWEIRGEFGDLSLSPDHVASKSKNINVPVNKNHQLTSSAKSETFIHTFSGSFINDVSSGNDTESSVNFGNIDGSADVSLKAIAELIIYKRLLDENEMTKVESYLALKYGVSMEQNYLNGKGAIIRNWEKQKRFSHHIAGIGRDDLSALYQKQSSSCTSSEDLVIGVNKIVTTNALNTGKINDGDFLIWGDNGEEFIALNPSDLVNEYLFSEKKWLITATGQNSNTISTEIKINTKTFLPKKFPATNFYLVIDRSASGFKHESCVYITPDDISPYGIATFKNILWDTDGSGKDNFTFAYKPDPISDISIIASDSANNKLNIEDSGLKSFSTFPNPVTGGICRVDIQLDEPTDFEINLYDLSQQLISSRKVTGQQSYQFTEHINGKPGSYIFQFISSDREYYRIIIVQ